MGCYETFLAKCPKCGRDWECQSKIGECRLTTVRIGDIAPGFPDMRFRVKWPCDCGIHPVVVIEGGRAQEGGETHIEGQWGAVEEL